MRKPKQEKYACGARVALWLRRDPIEERGGLNLYGMVDKNSINHWDYLGLAKVSRNEDGSSTIKVGKCEVAIIIGHGNYNRPHTVTFPHGLSCSGAGVAHCGSSSTNAAIPEANRIPGSPNWTDDVYSGDDRYAQGIQAIRNGARRKAEEICRDVRQCCKKVKIRSVYAPKGDITTDVSKRDSLHTETVDCSQYR